MPAQVLTDLPAEVAEIKTTIDSAIATIKGIKGAIRDAVAKAMENGATAAELEPLSALVTELDSKDKELAAAIAANTEAEETPS
jgi:hypothetical protein